MREETHIYNNFRIFKHRASDMPHLELAGSFDANLAAELIIFEAHRYGVDGISVNCKSQIPTGKVALSAD